MRAALSLAAGRISPRPCGSARSMRAGRRDRSGRWRCRAGRALRVSETPLREQRSGRILRAQLADHGERRVGGRRHAAPPGSVAYRACTSTSRCMCTESPPPCARQRFRMSLPALRLYHARTNGGAVLESAVVAGATRPSGAWYGTATAGMCAVIPTPPGVTPGPSIPCVGVPISGPGPRPLSRNLEIVPNDRHVPTSRSGPQPATHTLLLRPSLLPGWECNTPKR